MRFLFREMNANCRTGPRKKNVFFLRGDDIPMDFHFNARVVPTACRGDAEVSNGPEFTLERLVSEAVKIVNNSHGYVLRWQITRNTAREWCKPEVSNPL